MFNIIICNNYLEMVSANTKSRMNNRFHANFTITGHLKHIREGKPNHRLKRAWINDLRFLKNDNAPKKIPLMNDHLRYR
ncbi:MAG: hypothetical protein JWP38_2459 [Herbaspirillum sp.]|nr:hypothetical protein [Herbaspirillum sp.]